MTLRRRINLYNALVTSVSGGIIFFILLSITTLPPAQLLHAAVSLLSIPFTMVAQYALNASWLAPIERFETGGPDVDRKEALMAVWLLPARASASSLGFWVLCSSIIAGTLHYVAEASGVDALAVLLSILAGGGVAFALQYFLYRRALAPMVLLLQEEMARHGEVPPRPPLRAGLTAKFLTAFVLLTILFLLFSQIVGVVKARAILREQAASVGVEYLERAAEHLKEIEAAGKGPEEIQRWLADLTLGRSGYATLVDARGEEVVKAALSRIDPAVVAPVLTAAPEGVLRGGGLREHRSAVVGQRVFVAVPAGGGRFLLGVFPSDEFDLSREVRAAALFTLVAFLLTTGVAIFAARDAAAPLERLGLLMGRAAGGEMARDIALVTEDEVGTLAHGVQEMIQSLREAFGGIGRVVGAVEGVAREVAAETVKTASGARAQVQTVEEGTAWVEERLGAIDRVLGKIDSMGGAIRDGSASALGTGSVMNEIADGMGSLVKTVDHAGSLTGELEGVVRRIADHLGELGGLTGTAVGSVGEVRRFLEEVRRTAEEGTALAALVEEEGPRGRSLTLSVFERARAIQGSLERAEEVIAGLERKAGAIREILEAIDDVAEDTNLLALNAFILAAQAREEGRGFSVVADGIKTLADRTEASTRDIGKIIEAIGLEVPRAALRFREGTEAARRAAEAAADASEALREVLREGQETHAKLTEMTASAENAGRLGEQASTSVGAVAEAIRELSGTREVQARALDDLGRSIRDVSTLAGQVQGGAGALSTESRAVIGHFESMLARMEEIQGGVNEQREVRRALEERLAVLRGKLDRQAEAARRMEEERVRLERGRELLQAALGGLAV